MQRTVRVIDSIAWVDNMVSLPSRVGAKRRIEGPALGCPSVLYRKFVYAFKGFTTVSRYILRQTKAQLRALGMTGVDTQQ
jgi:hypothetical protein